jgi:hypothetical protein
MRRDTHEATQTVYCCTECARRVPRSPFKETRLDGAKAMTWMKVSIEYKDVTAVQEAAKALLNKLSASCLAAGATKDAKVYRGRLPTVGEVYYLPPAVSACCASVLTEFKAVACEHPPTLESLSKIDL